MEDNEGTENMDAFEYTEKLEYMKNMETFEDKNYKEEMKNMEVIQDIGNMKKNKVRVLSMPLPVLLSFPPHSHCFVLVCTFLSVN